MYIFVEGLPLREAVTYLKEVLVSSISALLVCSPAGTASHLGT